MRYVVFCVYLLCCDDDVLQESKGEMRGVGACLGEESVYRSVTDTHLL